MSSDLSTYLNLRVARTSIDYQPEGPQSHSLSSSRSSPQQAPVQLETLRKAGTQRLDERLKVIDDQGNFTFDTLAFRAIDLKAVQKALASMKQTTQNYSFGTLLTLAGAVYAGRRTYVDYATLAKMPFWLRVAGTTVLVFAALFCANKADAAEKGLKSREANYGWTVQDLIDQRNALLSVKSKVISSPSLSQSSADVEVPLFALPKNPLPECLGEAERQALFNEKATQWMQATTKSSGDLNAMETLLFKGPTPLSTETLQFYHGDRGVQHFVRDTAQIAAFQHQCKSIPASAKDRETRVGALVDQAMQIFSTAAQQLIKRV